MFKKVKLKLRYKTDEQLTQIIENLSKSDKVTNIQVEDDHVTYEQYGWSNE